MPALSTQILSLLLRFRHFCTKYTLFLGRNGNLAAFARFLQRPDPGQPSPPFAIFLLSHLSEVGPKSDGFLTYSRVCGRRNPGVPCPTLPCLYTACTTRPAYTTVPTVTAAHGPSMQSVSGRNSLGSECSCSLGREAWRYSWPDSGQEEREVLVRTESGRRSRNDG